MQGGKSRHIRDPYFYVKMINMVISCAIIVLTALRIFLPGMPGFTLQLILILGIVMCALTGIMELAKGKPFTGYPCSVLAGLLAVALILSIIGSILW